jgi:hypothetical protein
MFRAAVALLVPPGEVWKAVGVAILKESPDEVFSLTKIVALMTMFRAQAAASQRLCSEEIEAAQAQCVQEWSGAAQDF